MKTRFALMLTLSLAATSASAEDGLELWKTKCKACHGDDGKAQTKMGQKESIADLTQAAWQKSKKDADIRAIILEGSQKNAKMRPFKEKLTPEQVDALVKYIRGMQAK